MTAGQDRPPWHETHLTVFRAVVRFQLYDQDAPAEFTVEVDRQFKVAVAEDGDAASRNARSFASWLELYGVPTGILGWQAPTPRDELGYIDVVAAFRQAIDELRASEFILVAEVVELVPEQGPEREPLPDPHAIY